MSRIGNKNIVLPEGVSAEINGSTVTIKGPKGTLTKTFEPLVDIKLEGNVISFAAKDSSKHAHQMHGTTRAIVNNFVVGVTQGYEKVLKVIGTGYKFELKNGGLVVNVGYSNPIDVAPKAGITFEVPKPDELHVKGIDKEVVGQQSAEIRDLRRPEPYHGKGIRYINENVRHKEIKKAAK